jgi:uncharacterized protein YeaO (DUF488 family)
VSFQHASVYEPPAEDDCGWRVLIMRQWPRGVRKDRVHVWMKDASPSNDLLQAYHHAGLPWDQFESRYRHEIVDERPEVLAQLRGLERQHGTVILLCYERMPPYVHCHRLILLNLLDSDVPT